MQEKSGLHPRNKNRFPYQFDELVKTLPELAKFKHLNKFGSESIDFANPKAVLTLNKALLKHFYSISFWEIPDGYLCPPIPGRADYIHHLADLLGDSKPNPRRKLLDIGTGANVIYPLLGFKEYGWNFVGSDIDSIAISNAQHSLDSNSISSNSIELRLQKDSKHYFKHVIKSDEFFDATLCNPPFHESIEQALKGTTRKWKNVGKGRIKENTLNFGGQSNELWCAGGEFQFIKGMILESKLVAKQVGWFTCLVSKKSNLPSIYALFDEIEPKEIKTIEMSQGQKTSRFVAWRF